MQKSVLQIVSLSLASGREPPRTKDINALLKLYALYEFHLISPILRIRLPINETNDNRDKFHNIFLFNSQSNGARVTPTSRRVYKFRYVQYIYNHNIQIQTRTKVHRDLRLHGSLQSA